MKPGAFLSQQLENSVLSCCTAISSLQFFRQLMTPVMSYMVDEKVEKMAEW